MSEVDPSESIKRLYRRIGADFMAASRKPDPEKREALIALTVALEKAYPNEMTILRKEKIDA